MKTLKDIEINIDAGPNVPGVFSDDLKEAAGEWIDAIENEKFDEDGYGVDCIDDVGIMCDEYHCDFVKEWIKHFFNLEDK